MINRLANWPEVKVALLDAAYMAARNAARTATGPNAMHERLRLMAGDIDGVRRVVRSVGVLKFRNTSASNLWLAIDESERARITWTYVEMFARLMQEAAADAMDEQVQARACVLACHLCTVEFAAHGDGHAFRCPHGEQVDAAECVLDHPEVER